ncbi:chromate transporter [Egicoccus sp. AB-alg6-2]|uniref:chromate transporter n=1 Tax=Egicoccus sp. AB-alg6-2 TaxID=3242692 RepID=UPI00359DE059
MTASVPLFEIFFFVALSSLFSFGGGNGQIPVVQAQWVESGLLSPGGFSMALAFSHLTPGPKAGFIAGVGYYLAGVPGAIIAVAGLALPTCLGAAGVSYAAARLQRLVRLVTPSSGFVLAALIAAAAWGTAKPMRLGIAEVSAVIVIAALVAWRNASPVLLVLGAVLVGGLWSGVQLLIG